MLLEQRALVVIERPPRERLSDMNRRCFAKPEEFPRADKIRPRSAFVVGEPEAVKAEHDVRGEDHGRVPGEVARRRSPAGRG